MRRAVAWALLLLVVACGDDVNPDSAVDGTPGPSVTVPTEDSSTAAPTVAAATADSTAAAESTTTTISRPLLQLLSVELEPVATLSAPVAIATDPASGDIFVAEQRRQVVRLGEDGARSMLDFSGELSTGNEQGLLGLVFSPDGAHLFTNHTDRDGENVVLRFDMVDGEPDPDTMQVILRVEQLRGNHNGGHLAFGPDGYLWIGLGDGGGGGDPGDNGQNPSTFLGSMLRIAPTDDGYAIPADNPFAAGGEGAPEVAMWGLRNPWKYSFDSATGDLWIGDVGQDRFEEVSVVRDGVNNLGVNFGWNEMEGRSTYRQGEQPDDHHAPVLDYAQTNGRCSVTGGEVYRGDALPELRGAYVFGDFCSGEIFAIDSTVDDPDVLVLDINVPQVSSFGIDADGELLVASRGGEIHRIVRP